MVNKPLVSRVIDRGQLNRAIFQLNESVPLLFAIAQIRSPVEMFLS